VPQPKKFGNKTWKKVSKKNKEKDFNKINFWQKFIRKIFFILINAVTTIFFQKTIFYMNEVKQNIMHLHQIFIFCKEIKIKIKLSIFLYTDYIDKPNF
jgi:hypothetical protein